MLLQLCINDSFSEGQERYFDQLEMLAGERDTDDGNEEQKTKAYMGNRYPEAAEQEPDNIHEGIEAPTGRRRGYRGTAKGPEHKRSELKTLQAEGNANDGETQHRTAYDIAKGCDETAEEEPDDVAERVHERWFGCSNVT